MPLDSVGPLNRLVDVLEALPGMETVYVGVPEAPGGRASAYVALAGQDVPNETNDLVQRRARYFVGFVYAVEGAEADAELTVAGFVDGLVAALLAERTTGMGGLVDSIEWDFSLGDSPEYQPIAGREYRVFAVVVTLIQHATYG